MSYVKIPLASSNQAVGIRQLGQARDNLENIISILAREHGSADGVFDTGQSAIGRHDGAGILQSSVMIQRLVVSVVNRPVWTGNNRFQYMISEPHPDVAPIRDTDSISAGNTLIRVRGFETVCGLIATPLAVAGSALISPTAGQVTFCTTSIERVTQDDFPWRITVRRLGFADGSTSGPFTEVGVGFTLQIWGK
jgi:hypothetical protein